MLMVTDGAGWHRNQDLAIPENMRLLTLPSYAPELDPVGQLWDELREKWFLNRVFDSLDLWKVIWKQGFARWKDLPGVSAPLFHGPGLSIHF